MSLFERGAASRALNGNNYGRGGNNNRQNNNMHNSGKAAQQRKFANKAEEVIRRFEDDENSTAKVKCSSDPAQVETVRETLSSFVSAFEKNIDKPTEIKSLIEEDFDSVVAAMKFYYDDRYEDALSDMNRLLDIMSTNHFATILLGILKQNTFGDDWDSMWKDVALTISILLETSSSKMKDGTVQIYVSDILASSGMWKNEIRQMVDEIGITEELATDLIIGLPIRPEDMNDLMMRSTYQAFLWSILEHAEDNIEVLDRNAQRKLFDFFFDERGGKGGKLACKVIGRFLSDPEPEKEMDGAAALIYGEFKAMLLDKLESYDVNNIAFVLRFIVEQRKRGKGKTTIFNAEEAAKYDTIRKAIMQVISKDESAKEYLV